MTEFLLGGVGGVGGGGSVELTKTASENIDKGDPIYIDDSGEWAKAVLEEIGVTVTGIEAVGASASWRTDICRITDNKIAVIYRGATNYGYAVIIEVGDNGQVISYGTPQKWSGTNEIVYTGCCAPDEDKIFIAYYNSTQSNYLYGIAGTVSGTVITFGAETAIDSTAMQSNIGCRCCEIDTDKVGIVYSQAAWCGVVACTISGTTITPGTPAALDAADDFNSAYCYKNTTDKMFGIYQKQSDSTYRYFHATASGANFTVNHTVSFGTAQVFFCPLGVDKFIQYLTDNTYDFLYVRSVTGGGTGIAYDYQIRMTYDNLLYYSVQGLESFEMIADGEIVNFFSRYNDHTNAAVVYAGDIYAMKFKIPGATGPIKATNAVKLSDHSWMTQRIWKVVKVNDNMVAAFHEYGAYGVGVSFYNANPNGGSPTHKQHFTAIADATVTTGNNLKGVLSGVVTNTTTTYEIGQELAGPDGKVKAIAIATDAIRIG